MDALDYLLLRRQELDAHRLEQEAYLQRLIGGVAELDYAIEQIQSLQGDPVALAVETVEDNRVPDGGVT